jgi:hypothetical protein
MPSASSYVSKHLRVLKSGQESDNIDPKSWAWHCIGKANKRIDDFFPSQA